MKLLISIALVLTVNSTAWAYKVGTKDFYCTSDQAPLIALTSLRCGKENTVLDTLEKQETTTGICTYDAHCVLTDATLEVDLDETGTFKKISIEEFVEHHYGKVNGKKLKFDKIPDAEKGDILFAFAHVFGEGLPHLMSEATLQCEGQIKKGDYEGELTTECPPPEDCKEEFLFNFEVAGISRANARPAMPSLDKRVFPKQFKGFKGE